MDTTSLVTSATIEISAVVGLDYVIVETPTGYNITINTTSLGHWSLLIRASSPHYQNASMTFDFEVRETDTSLSGDGPPTNIYFGVEYSFLLTFSHNVSNGIENATIVQTYRGVQGNPFSWVDYDNGTYGFSFTAGDPGSYMASIEFSKYGYESADISLSFTILELPTIFTTTHLPDPLYGSRIYQVCIYVTSTDMVPVEAADVIYSNSINPFVTSEDFANGWYNITFSPESGNFSDAIIHIKKHGYSEVVVDFPLTVTPIPIVFVSGYSLEASYSRMQGTNLPLSLRLTAGDTGEELTDAVISYMIHETGTRGTFEVQTDGTYTTVIQVPQQTGTYHLRVSITKLQFTEQYIEVILISEYDPEALAREMFVTGVETSALLVGIAAVIYAGSRHQKKKAMRRQMEILDYRARLSDANNVIGFLIIQRNTGLPIYSKIIKGGFEMSMISGFISAISNFAMEIRTEEKLWTPIPISEVVTAVQTNELICALLTVDSPSKNLFKALEEISFLIGSRFDSFPDLLTTISRQTDKAIEYKSEFDNFFETQFDYRLLISYSSYDLSRKGAFPLIEQAIISGDLNRPFHVTDLVRYLITSGIEETKAYSLVIEAAESSFLLLLDEPLPSS